MHDALIAALVVSWALTVFTLFNLSGFIEPTQITEGTLLHSSVDILIPARNEEVTISQAVTSALGQTSLASCAVRVLNDQSTDRTLEKLVEFGDAITIVNTQDELPSGWLGKNWACHRLAQQSSAEYLVFIDSDVTLEPHAVASAITTMNNSDLEFISPYPRQIANTWLTRLVQPLLQWSFLTTVPLKKARTSMRPSFAVANGQFIVCRRDAYLEAGGHEGIKDCILDDIELLRSFLRHGFHGTVANGTTLATCEMYDSNRALVDGYSKSLWKAFGGPVGSIAVNAFLLFVYSFPLVSLFGPDRDIAVLALLCGEYGRWFVARKTQQRVLPDAFFHSVSIVAFAWLNCVSWARHLRKTNTWKGRTVDAP